MFRRDNAYAIIFLLSRPIWQRKGGCYLSIITSFFVSVVAGVASYYICKWLDRDNNDD